VPQCPIAGDAAASGLKCRVMGSVGSSMGSLGGKDGMAQSYGGNGMQPTTVVC